MQRKFEELTPEEQVELLAAVGMDRATYEKQQAQAKRRRPKHKSSDTSTNSKWSEPSSLEPSGNVLKKW